MWSLLKTYASRFAKKEPGNPFDTLLTDEDSFRSSYQSYTKKDRIMKAKRFLSQASEDVFKYKEEVNEEGQTETEAEQTTTEIVKVIKHSTKLVNDLELGLVIDIDYAILSSSWLQSGLHAFTRKGNEVTPQEARDYIDTLLLMVVSLMSRVVYSAFRLGGPLGLIYKALMLLIDLPVEFKDNEVGTLTISIVKKPRPSVAQFKRGYIKRYSKRMSKVSRIYGPYKYHNVPLKVWKDMKQARGSFGSGAGKVFWTRYLRNLYGYPKGLKHGE